MRKKTITAVVDKRAEENGLNSFTALMQEVAALPPDQQEKVCLYMQGFIACSTSRQKRAV